MVGLCEEHGGCLWRSRVRPAGRVLAALLLVCLLGSVWLCPACRSGGEPADTTDVSVVSASLVRVVDGDTIVVRMPGASEERLRYIGIDAPESVQPGEPVEYLGLEASTHNEDLLRSGSIRLSFDVEERDRHGRLLAYVWAGDVFVNERMVRDGFAWEKRYPPNLRLQETLAEAERAARAAGVGLWSPDAVVLP
jgi:micrococcal nuclease